MDTVQAADRLTPLAGGSGRKAVDGADRSGIVARDLELWRGDYRVCHSLSLAVADGQLMHLRGANGAGKTSLLRALASLTVPDSGEIRLDGRSISRNMNHWRASICYVSHSDGIKRELTPYENLRLASRLLADSPGNERAALERVGLERHADRLCGELSAGQRRRVALARLVVSRARIWLLDEPLVSLDRAGAGLLEALLREHLEGGGIAVIATHQPIDFSGLDVVPVDLPQGPELC